MQPEEEEYIKNMQDELAFEQSQSSKVARGINTMFQGEENQNLVKWQLDISNELERIEHLLKKDILKIDKEGNETWEDCAEENKLLSTWGVAEVLNILHWYLNKNIILSNFSIDEIKVRMNQLAYELTDFLYCNTERMGLTDDEGIKHYPMIILNLVNTIESAYHRSLAGGERRSLREARTITQSENLGGMNQNMNTQPMQPRKRFKLWRPSTWS